MRTAIDTIASPCKSTAILAARRIVQGDIGTARALLWNIGLCTVPECRALLGAVKLANVRYDLRPVYGSNGLIWRDVVWGWTFGDETYRA